LPEKEGGRESEREKKGRKEENITGNSTRSCVVLGIVSTSSLQSD
jgi:hypothetical protein